MSSTYRLRAALVIALVFTLLDEGATADLDRGRSIALRWCSECHIVAPGQAHGSDSAPTFAEISQSKPFNEARLQGFLLDPQHSRMPNLSLTHTEISDLVEYIRALHH